MRLALAVMLLLLTSNGWAAFVPLDPKIGKYVLTSHSEYLEDRSAEWGIEEVSRGEWRDDFRSTSNTSSSFGWSKSAYWLRFSPINTSAQAQNWLLEFSYTPLDQIDIWRVDRDSAIFLGRSGDSVTHQDKPINHFKHTFNIVLDAEQKTDIYVRVKTESLFKLGMTLWSEPDFEQYQRRELTKQALTAGLLLALVLYNLLMFLQLRDKNYLLLSLTLMSVGIQQASHVGVAAEWLWPNSPALCNYAPILSSSATLACLIVFFRSFLQSKIRTPRIDIIFKIFMGYFAAVCILLFFNHTLSARLVTYAALPAVFFDFFACAYIWNSGFKSARILMVAWGFYLFSLLLYVLALIDLLPDIVRNLDFLILGSSVSAILFSIALSDRFKLIQDDQKRLKDQVINHTQGIDQLKSTFLATVSHELRTPIHGINGCLDMIDSEFLDDNNKQAINMAYQSSHHLERLIERLLQFSEATSGKIKSEVESYPFANKFSKLIKDYQQLYPSVGITLEPIPKQCNWLMIDGKKLLTAVQQLLDNACQFSARRHVLIEVKNIQKQLIIVIEDTGVGIRSTEMNKVSKAFCQNNQDFDRRHGGLGVGLTLANSLIKLLGGNITIESMWGRGTKVTLEIGAEECTTPIQKPTKKSIQENTAPSSVLIAEDNPVNQKVLSAMLKKLNCTVTCVDNGEGALDYIQSSDSHIDIIFMDCQMPIMDGFEATRRIRQLESSCGRDKIPIIAVTANAMSGDKENCLNAGMSDYLAKPVTIDQIKKAIQRFRA